MIKTKDILSEFDKRLRTVSQEVSFPLTKDDKKLIKDMIKYLTDSQIEELSEKYDLRPGMGLSAIQLGVAKRYFVIVEETTKEEDLEQSFKTYIIVNPTLVSHSEELVYAEFGEGCLSINREVDGIIPRYARVTVEGYDIDGNKISYRAREEVSIAFQHEIDHLNGILFIDRIDKDNPFKDENTMRPI
jgi:peptide deformylase